MASENWNGTAMPHPDFDNMTYFETVYYVAMLVHSNVSFLLNVSRILRPEWGSGRLGEA